MADGHRCEAAGFSAAAVPGAIRLGPGARFASSGSRAGLRACVLSFVFLRTFPPINMEPDTEGPGRPFSFYRDLLFSSRGRRQRHLTLVLAGQSVNVCVCVC